MSTRLLAYLPAVFLPKRTRVDVQGLMDLWRSRRALARLDAAGRADIGQDHASCAREAQRPLWDVPDHWTD